MTKHQKIPKPDSTKKLFQIEKAFEYIFFNTAEKKANLFLSCTIINKHL